MFIIPEPRRLRQEGKEFETSLIYIERLFVSKCVCMYVWLSVYMSVAQKRSLLGQWDGSVGEVGCCQHWQSEFNSQNQLLQKLFYELGGGGARL